MEIEVNQGPDQGLMAVMNRVMLDSDNVVESQSRNGPVRRFRSPTSIIWKNPIDRVSFSSIRDANPFFHLFEAFWMLAGENDVESVSYFASNMRNYSDDGKTLAGAYGYRWRKHFKVDQIDAYIIPSLKKNPEDRRCVLQMWDPVEDIQNGRMGGKDLCCNLCAIFEVQNGKLNMEVNNRSNDIVFGACGANIVHFSVLQEYVASALDLKVGTYTQHSANMHLYTEFDITKRYLENDRKGLREANAELTHIQNLRTTSYPLRNAARFTSEVWKTAFDSDCRILMRSYKDKAFLSDTALFGTDFFADVVRPMMLAFAHYKEGDIIGAREIIFSNMTGERVALDWFIAADAWLYRREDARLRKANKQSLVQNDFSTNVNGVPYTNFNDMFIVGSDAVKRAANRFTDKVAMMGEMPVEIFWMKEVAETGTRLSKLVEEARFNVLSLDQSLDSALEDAVYTCLVLYIFTLPISQRLIGHDAYIQRCVETAIEKDRSYGSSWCRRGGIGAWFTIVRKFDRLTGQIEQGIKPSDGEEMTDTLIDAVNYCLLVMEKRYAIRNTKAATVA